MTTESERAREFVLRLLSNPALNDFADLQKEEQIIRFLRTNAARLAPALAGHRFFPGKSWQEIFPLLSEALYRMTDRQLLPELKSIIGGDISFSFMPFLQLPLSRVPDVRNQITAFLEKLLANGLARREFTGAYAAIRFRVIDRYMDEVFARKSYVHFELTKVQRLRLGKEEMRGMIHATLMLKPAVHMVAARSLDEQRGRSRSIRHELAETIAHALRRQLPLVPERLIRSAVNTGLSFTDNRFVDATSRIAAIFAARCRSYHPRMGVDRGADTPDKSWMSTARRNHRFHGFDIRMLDEFHNIAAENGW